MLKCLFYGLAYTPRPIRKFFALTLTPLFYLLARDRRRTGLYNLRMAFPEVSAIKRHWLLLAHIDLTFLALLDLGVLWLGSKPALNKLVKEVGVEHANDKNQRAQIWFAPHFIGLEAGGIRVADERKLAALYVQPKSATLGKLMTYGRLRFGQTRMLSRQDGIRAYLKAHKDGHTLHYSPDQDFGAKEALFVPFFGKDAATVTALPRLAKALHAEVVPVVTTMTKRGYETRFYPAWADYPSDNLEADLRRINAFLEDLIREYPAQYFWLHKRYKSRPIGEVNPYTR